MNTYERRKVSRPATPPKDKLSLCQRLKALPRDVMFCYVALLLIVLISSGCCAKPALLPCTPLPPVSMPALTEPLPLVDYSISAGKNIGNWASTLTGTSATSKR